MDANWPLLKIFSNSTAADPNEGLPSPTTFNAYASKRPITAVGYPVIDLIHRVAR